MRTAISPWAAHAVALLLGLALAAPTLGQEPPPAPPPLPPGAPQPPVPFGAPPPPPPGAGAHPNYAPPPHGSLEAMLSEALKNNPDVRVAEAKLREAEAVLHQARMQVMQKVVALQSALQSRRAAVKEAEASYKLAEAQVKRFEGLSKQNAIPVQLLEEQRAKLEAAKQKLVVAKAQLAELDSEAGFLLGKGRVGDFRPHRPPFEVYDHVEFFQEDQALRARMTPAPGSPTGKLRKALDKPVKLDFKDRSLKEVARTLQETCGVPFVLATRKLGLGETQVTLRVEGMPLGAALEMLEDTLGNVRFAVRDYGVLVTAAEHLPPGAVPLDTFWHPPFVPLR